MFIEFVCAEGISSRIIEERVRKRGKRASAGRCALLNKHSHLLQFNYPEAAYMDDSQRTHHTYLTTTGQECIICCLHNKCVIYI
jgi:hypothetical protein